MIKDFFGYKKVFLLIILSGIIFILGIIFIWYQLNISKEFTVDFIDYEGKVFFSITGNQGTKIDYPQDLNQEGYVFLGWDQSVLEISQDLKVQPLYNRLNYEVTYLDESGNIIKSEIVFFGEDSTPPIITKEGFVLVGWSENHKKITQDLTLTPTFETAEFIVSFINSDGTIIETQIVEYGNKIIIPSEPIRENFRIKGWYTSLDSGLTLHKPWDFNLQVYNSDLNLYVNWAREYNFEIFDSNNNLISQEKFIEGQSININSTNIPTFADHSIVGFNPEIPKIMPNNDVLIQVEYKYIGYLFFDSETGTITGYNEELGGPKVIIPRMINGVRVDKIGEFSLSEKNLTEVIIPNSVSSIGTYAFGFNNLINIEIPNSVEFISTGAFSNNNLSELNIPNSIKIIDDFAFNYNQISKLSIPNSVVEIGRMAFGNNPITELTIPSSVKKFGLMPFEWRNINDFSIEGDNFVYENNLLFNSDKSVLIAGIGYRSILEIPDTVNEVQEYAFSKNTLRFVTIPNSVTKIGGNAFSFNQINTIKISEYVSSIGSYAFAYNQLTELIIPDSITTIPDGVFTANQITNVSLPKSLKKIGSFAFDNNQIRQLILPESLTTIGNYAFKGNQITELILPKTLNELGLMVFDWNNLEYFINLSDSFIYEENLLLNSNKTTIIAGIGKLDSITIPSSVETIGERAFDSNIISAVTIPNSVINIRVGAFHDNQITNLVIPESVINILAAAFSNNPLTSIFIEGDETRFNRIWEQIGFPLELLKTTD
jgi:hypothetical protein